MHFGFASSLRNSLRKHKQEGREGSRETHGYKSEGGGRMGDYNTTIYKYR